jgi:hypothetical protein
MRGEAPSLEDRLSRSGPKRILSLDGGGARGLLSAGILEEIEVRLRKRYNNPQVRLCDYFDLIGGTSTGAIVAAGLALGKTAAEVAQFYRDVAPAVFDESQAAKGLRKPRYKADALEQALLEAYGGEHRLDSPALRTGLAIFTKRLDTGSPWSIVNLPRSRFWDADAAGQGTANRALLLHKIVLASAAAPTFFDGRRIQVTAGGPLGEFVDGAVAGLNNPSLQLLQIATQKAFGLEWPTGNDRLMMVSVGTGYWRQTLTDRDVGAEPLAKVAPIAIKGVMSLTTMIHDVGLNTLATIQGLAQTPRPWVINAELAESSAPTISPVPLLLFQRMDARIDRENIAKLGMEVDDQSVARMRELGTDDEATLGRLYEIGLRAGQAVFANADGDYRNWEREILPKRFDPPGLKRRLLGPPSNRLEALGRTFERDKKPAE